jgi:PHD/YefM family antitoxin component YafN of YafNO toxin-antitoxin module
MHRVSTADLIRNFGIYGDEAISKPVILTKNDRDRLVLISIELYEKLKHAYDAVNKQPRPNQSR